MSQFELYINFCIFNGSVVLKQVRNFLIFLLVVSHQLHFSNCQFELSHPVLAEYWCYIRSFDYLIFRFSLLFSSSKVTDILPQKITSILFTYWYRFAICLIFGFFQTSLVPICSNLTLGLGFCVWGSNLVHYNIYLAGFRRFHYFRMPAFGLVPNFSILCVGSSFFVCRSFIVVSASVILFFLFFVSYVFWFIQFNDLQFQGFYVTILCCIFLTVIAVIYTLAVHPFPKKSCNTVSAFAISSLQSTRLMH